jgi:hypothetical protein
MQELPVRVNRGVHKLLSAKKSKFVGQFMFDLALAQGPDGA